MSVKRIGLQSKAKEARDKRRLRNQQKYEVHITNTYVTSYICIFIYIHTYIYIYI